MIGYWGFRPGIELQPDFMRLKMPFSHEKGNSKCHTGGRAATGAGHSAAHPQSQAAFARAAPGSDAFQALFGAYGGELLALDSGLHPFSPQTASPGDGSAGSAGVSDAPGGGKGRGGFHAKRGAQRSGVPLRAGVAPAAGTDRGVDAADAAGGAAGGAEAGGGETVVAGGAGAAWTGGAVVVWHGAAGDGRGAVAGEGCRFWGGPHPGARWQRVPGSDDDAAAEFAAVVAG